MRIARPHWYVRTDLLDVAPAADSCWYLAGRQERSAAEAQAAYSVAQDSSRRGDYEQARSLLEALVDKHSATLFKQHAVLCESPA